MAALVVACAAWAVLSAWQTIVHAGAGTLRVLWLVPGLIALHVGELLLSAEAWRTLLLRPPAGWQSFLRWRLVREGIDSLLPVAQVGGELVGAQLLARCGVPLGLAAATVVVDVTLEFLSQIMFLLIGVMTWTFMSPGAVHGAWLGLAGLSAVSAGALLATQRLGGLRLLESLVRAIASRLPALGALSLEGLHAETALLYGRRIALLGAGLLHLFAWTLGTIETWTVLAMLDLPVGWQAALVVESLGMAARSAGFAIPGALVVQETGFVLAAMAVGLPEEAGLTLSLVKRVREIGSGLIGLALWRRGTRARA